MHMEWSFRLLFLGLLAVGLIGMFICRRWPLAAVLILPLMAWGGANLMTELNHLYADEAITAKPGTNLRYIVLFYVVIASGAVFVIVGALQGWRQRKSGVHSR
jgi:hypothetical protein